MAKFRKLIVLGGGGHAEVVVDAMMAAGDRPAGIADLDPSLAQRLGVRSFSDSDVHGFDRDEVHLVLGIGGMGRREKLCLTFRSAGFEFASVIHPGSVVAGDVMMGDGVQIMAGAVVQPRAELSGHVIVNTRSSIDHNCVVGEHSHIAPGATLCGDVVVGSKSHVGAGATVVEGMVVGSNCMIAAGAVVTEQVPNGVMVAGVPARLKKPVGAG